MKKALKLAAYVTVLSLATVVAFAGPCEDGCNNNNTACTSQAAAACNQCFSNVATNNQQCYAEANAWFQNCLATVHQQEQSTCNLVFQQFEANCINEDLAGNEVCNMNCWTDQQYCANDYDNCLFICSNQ